MKFHKRRNWLLRLTTLGLCAALLSGSCLTAQAAEKKTATEKTKAEKTITEKAKTEKTKAEDTTEINYTIYVNRSANCVTVKSVDEQGLETPVKAFVCSCGKTGEETPTGTFTTSDYYEWCYMVDGSYGRYAIRINKGIMFHSVPYLTKSPDSMEWDQYNLLGEAASLGCIRLRLADVKWLYDNCKPGTKVVIYDNAKDPGELGKPEITTISKDNPCRGWDPTDPDENNPWRAARFNGVTYETFDAVAYAFNYPDVKAAFGTDKKLLWQHFNDYGWLEGRTIFPIPTIENFNAASYAERYPDLKAAFGTDEKLLWKHYMESGRFEGRTY